MNYNREYKVAPQWKRVIGVWLRHIHVYKSSFISNAVPPFFEPLIFLAGLGMGIGAYMQNYGESGYMAFLASGLIITSAMYTSVSECTYGTFMRLEFDKVYDGMLGAPLSPNDIIFGEILFAGTKGAFFSSAVLLVLWILGIISYPLSILSIFVGFLTGIMFGLLGMLITSLVKNINQFNFFFTGVLSPMFFFSGVIFPIEKLPAAFVYVAEIIPLTHVLRLARALCIPGRIGLDLILDLGYCLVFTGIVAYFAIGRLRRKIIK